MTLRDDLREANQRKRRYRHYRESLLARCDRHQRGHQADPPTNGSSAYLLRECRHLIVQMIAYFRCRRRRGWTKAALRQA